MSDYMFMLENHLTAAQNRVLAEVQKAAAEAQINLFLTGGAVRDMFGGFPIRDLDFTVEGNALKLAKTVADRLGRGDSRKRTRIARPPNCVSAEGVTFEIGMARTERYAKTGGKPQVTPATIHEDLAATRFHHQRAAPLAESGFARSAARSDERHGRSAREGTSQRDELWLL